MLFVQQIQLTVQIQFIYRLQIKINMLIVESNFELILSYSTNLIFRKKIIYKKIRQQNLIINLHGSLLLSDIHLTYVNFTLQWQKEYI